MKAEEKPEGQLQAWGLSPVPLALKVKEGVTSQGMLAFPRSWKRWEVDYPLVSPEGHDVRTPVF
jgi:hypothetical protein